MVDAENRSWAVREATQDDWDGIWTIFCEVAAEADTFALTPDRHEVSARRGWMTPSPGRVVIIASPDAPGVVLGTGNMYPNRPGRGSHVASGSFMVAAAARGRGIGRALVRDMLRWAQDQRFVAIQFNAVVETNTAAVQLYRSEGFRIIGTAPGAFIHPRSGAVGLHIMWCDLPVRNPSREAALASGSSSKGSASRDEGAETAPPSTRRHPTAG